MNKEFDGIECLEKIQTLMTEYLESGNSPGNITAYLISLAYSITITVFESPDQREIEWNRIIEHAVQTVISEHAIIEKENNENT